MSQYSENPISDAELLDRARAAAQNAYAPYSRFAVGAVVETDVGSFYGCNVENASYGLSICAERVALFAAVSAGAACFYRLAVACIGADSDADNNVPIESRMPCGACRQVIAEFMNGDAMVLVDGAGEWRVGDLLPKAFTLRSKR